MGFVLAPFVVVGVVVFVAWFFLFRAAVRHERAVERAKKRDADFDKLLRKPGEPLYCLACEKPFLGLIRERGCPLCQTAAFVIPAAASENQRIRIAGASLSSAGSEWQEQKVEESLRQENRNQAQ